MNANKRFGSAQTGDTDRPAGVLRGSSTLRVTLSIAMLIPVVVGCSSLTGKKDTGKGDSSFLKRFSLLGQKKDEDNPEPYPNPRKLAVAWTPDTLVQAGRTPTRGFGGRVFLYDENSRPVPVDGTLTIHGFDDSESSPEKRLKRFRFTPEQFTRHYSQSDLGASYSIWIPWDAVGGQQRQISLVASFQSQSGDVVQGAPATVVLPGRVAKPTQTELVQQSPQYQKFLDASLSAAPSSGLTTTTIARRAFQPEPRNEPGISLPETPATTTPQQIATSGTTPSMELAAQPSTNQPVAPESSWERFSPSKILPASATEFIER